MDPNVISSYVSFFLGDVGPTRAPNSRLRRLLLGGHTQLRQHHPGLGPVSERQQVHLQSGHSPQQEEQEVQGK